jgi:PAS domain S-box-containing protein
MKGYLFMMNSRNKKEEKKSIEDFLENFQLLNPKERIILQKKTELKERFGKGNFRLLDELQNSKVELELQNEELESARQELETSRNKYLDLFNSSPIGYFIFDKDGFISDVNVAGSRMLNISKDFLLNKMFHVYIAPESWDVFNEFFHSVMDEEKINNTSCEITMLNKDKEKFFAHVEGLKVTENGMDQCRIAVIDITERKMAEEALMKNSKELLFNKQLLEKRSRELAQVFVQLAKSERELRELNQNKNKFFTIISHDLRNPFSVLVGLTDILKKESTNIDSNKIQELADIMYSNTHKIHNLLNNLLEWSKIQFEKVNFQPLRIDLNDSVNQITELIYPLAKNKKIRIHNLVDNHLVAYADKNMLDSILQNLIANAIKFTSEGGNISITAEEKDKHVEISVSDNGIGIDPEILSRLFKIESYSKKGTSNEAGSALGLLLCKEQVEIHGGKIKVEAENGKGSRFIFTLPKESAQKKSDKFKKLKPGRNLSAA